MLDSVGGPELLRKVLGVHKNVGWGNKGAVGGGGWGRFLILKL